MNTLNSLLSTTTSRYTSLRRQLLSSSSEDDSQVDDPDSSHVSKVLRAYYTEKGRPFPPWLPPDPKAREQQQSQTSFASSAGSLRGSSGRTSGGPVAGAGARGSGGGLGDLWADSSAPVQAPQENGSLRRGLAGARLGARTRTQDPQESLAPRPLPSQRAGSYQTSMNQQGSSVGRTSSPVPPSSAGSGGSVQERLKARLGGRGTPPTLGRDRSEGSSGSYMDGGGSYDGGGGGSYGTGGANGGGYGGNPYEGGSGQSYGGVGRKPLRQGGIGLPSGPRQR